ncbi:MAG: bifunctional ADP-dependent NAD(P)H-hydrate dehydratase/NAD(P)H-hydrate epimerase [Deltaproteobacteria bacterium CG07_land_8_20_14_0_80_38_7]|nr:MAG: bifunctional ADP-dependent NAD(P)H-hydrate dehydratase/NAD(P)H-hydrate epimerase [Deltaproteobacteria bacterium CG07_land_8_20_14_0_80_38_7]
MKLVTAQQMQEADHAATKEFGIQSLSLMERAGNGVANFVKNHFKPSQGAISIIAGKGNNGGDGLVAARLLLEMGYEVLVFLTSPAHELSPDSYVNWERLVLLSPKYSEIKEVSELSLQYPHFLRSACIIDAIFGTGLSKDVRSPYREIIDLVNNLHVPILSCDLPSGLSSDTGMPIGTAIKARWTLTFGLPKVGLFVGKGPDFSGHVKIIDIGIPQQVINKVDSKIFLIDKTYFSHFLKQRDKHSHKGNYGHVVVIAGADEKLGAGYLSAMAALRSGAGLVTYCLPEKSFTKFDARYPEIMPIGLPDKGRGHLHPDALETALDICKDKSAVVIGPAIGTHPDTKAFIIEFIKRIHCPLVIDADGLNLISDQINIIDNRTSETILTPHPGEMERLINKEEIKKQGNRIPLAYKFATKHKVNLVLKGHRTIVVSSNGETYINLTGNAAMATAGMGDALTGIIAGFIAQKMPVDLAAVAGVFLHGLAGDIAAARIGGRGVITSDVIKIFPEAIQQIFL